MKRLYPRWGMLCSITTPKVFVSLFTILLLLITSQLPAQIIIQQGTVRANFGIDGDATSGTTQNAPWACGGALCNPPLPANCSTAVACTPSGTDDWFPGGTGFGVIDTSAASVAYALSQQGLNNGNTPFKIGKSFTTFQNQNGYLLLDAMYLRDGHSRGNQQDISVYAGSKDKSYQHPSSWNLGVGNVPQSNDIIDFYVSLRRDGPFVSDDLWALFGMSTVSNGGSANFNVEFYQTEIGYTPATGLTNLGPNNGHTQWTFSGTGSINQAGDINFSVDIGNTIQGHIYLWINPGTLPGGSIAAYNGLGGRPFTFVTSSNGQPVFYSDATSAPFGYAEIEPNSTSNSTYLDPDAYSSLNTAAVPAAPWGTIFGPQAHVVSNYPSESFAEVGFNLSRLGLDLTQIGGTGECKELFGGVMAMTRSSASFSAELKDFVGPEPFGKVDEAGVGLAGGYLDCNSPCIDLRATTSSPFPPGLLTYEWQQKVNGSWTTIAGPNQEDSIIQICEGDLYTTADSFRVILSAPDFAGNLGQGCASDSAVLVTSDFTPPNINSCSSTDVNCCLGQVGSVTVHTGVGGYTYQWVNTANGNVIGTDSSLSPVHKGTYRVYVMGSNGCVDSCDAVVDSILPPPINITCATNTTISTCLTQSTVNSLYAAWKATFGWSQAGCGASGSFIVDPGAPNHCGGASTVTWEVTDNCGQVESCSRTFTVPESPDIIVTCPTPVVMGACDSQHVIDAAYANWLGTFNTQGGCSPISTDLTPYATAPSACYDFDTTISITYIAHDDCKADTCSSTFFVPAHPQISVSCPDPVIMGACDSQHVIDAAYAQWLSEFQTTSVCNYIVTDLTPWQNPPSACYDFDTTIAITYIAYDDCNADTCSSTFTVPAHPQISVACPDPVLMDACDSQHVINAAYAQWLSEFQTYSVCNYIVTDLTPWQNPPSACYDFDTTISITYIAYDDCNADTCSSTFTVPAHPQISVSCPDPVLMGACDSQHVINVAYAQWLSEFQTTSTCPYIVTDLTPWQNPPSACYDFDTTIYIQYIAYDDCNADTCSSTFTVPAHPQISVVCPDPVLMDACDSQHVIDAAYAQWLSEFQTYSVCDYIVTDLTPWQNPPSACYDFDTTISITYIAYDDCNADTCSSTFTVPAHPQISVACPDPVLMGACDSQHVIDAAYAQWLSEFQTTSVCNYIVTDLTPWQNPPSACYDFDTTIAITYIAYDDCNADTCSSTFFVPAHPQISVSCPDPVIMGACDSQHVINAAYAQWLSEFQTTSVCNYIVTDLTPWQNPPSACYDFDTTIAITYIAYDDCNADTCSSTFFVPAHPPVMVNCPANYTAGGCDTQEEIDNAYSAWLAGFSVNAICAYDSLDLTPFEIAPSACLDHDTTVTITFWAQDECTYDACTATFTIPAQPSMSCSIEADTFASGYNISCYGESDGRFTVNVTGGCSPFLYSIDGGSTVQTSNVFDELPAGIYTVRVYDDCDSTECSVELTQPDPLECNITGFGVTEPLPCFSDSNQLFVSVTGGNGPYTYNWTLNSGTTYVITAGQNNDTVIYTCGVPGDTATFTIEITDAIGCVTSCEVLVWCHDGAYCTFTDGFYGNVNATDCNGTPSYTLIENAIANLGSPIIIGDQYGGANRLEVASLESPCVITRLPGSGASAAITAGPNYICMTTMPGIPQTGAPYFRINNTFVAQMLTLTLNIGLNSQLGDLHIPSGFVSFVTGQADSCYFYGANAYPGTEDTTSFPTSVSDYLNGGNGYSPDVQGLLDLSNDALAGLWTPSGSDPSLNDISTAIAAINHGFDECRVLLSWVAGAPAAKRMDDMTQAVEKNDRPSLNIYPNPTTSNVRIEILLHEDADVRVELFDLQGKRVAMMVNETATADVPLVADFNIDMLAAGTYIYKLTTESGKMLVGNLSVIR